MSHLYTDNMILDEQRNVQQRENYLQKDASSSTQIDIDEEELGSTEPAAFRLDPKDFRNPIDYVKSYVKEVRQLHSGDAKNDLRRKESLGHIFKTENLHPSGLREPLLDNAGRSLSEYFVTAFVPVLRENFSAHFHGTKRPRYYK
jgi:hypothetical protein